ncbi:MAG: sulfite exporter TauE/SafE family protein [Chitinophagaceae bacterium]
MKTLALVPTQKIQLKHIAWVIVLLKVLIVVYFVFLLIRGYEAGTLRFGWTFLEFVLIGFIAEVVDGALGMAYGVSCTSLLMNFGIPAKLATASVHTSEIFTTGVSGLSHIRFDNIDKKLFFQIVITGVIGSSIGAYLISDFFDGKLVKPFVAFYLLVLGFYILSKAFRKKDAGAEKEVKHAALLAFFGGLLDAVGGGGWGPIVTTNLLSQGKSPRHAIGTVNTAEFFVTYFATAIFIFILGVQHLQIVLGLIVGGVVAAPLGAYIASRINQKLLLVLVGILVILTSSLTLFPLILSKI